MSELSKIESSIGRLTCGNESGTAFYVGNGMALTCRHCVISHLLDPDLSISIAFGERLVEAHVADYHLPNEFDAVLLVVPDDVELERAPLVISHLPRGLDWTTFGFPRAHRDEGLWLTGMVSRWVGNPEGPSDTTLECFTFNSLTDYSGFSGAPVVVEGSVRGMLQSQREGGLRAISLARMRHHLSEAGVSVVDPVNRTQVPEELLDDLSSAIPNIETYSRLENAIRENVGSYVLLAGSPGSGKSLVAAGYSPSNDDVIVFGRFFARSPDPNAAPTSYFSRVEVFASWLSQLVMLFSRNAVVASESTSLSGAIEAIIENLRVLGDISRENQQLGVIIIDDVDAALDSGLQHFLQSLPTIPSKLVVVMTTTRPSLLRTTYPDLTVSEVVAVARLPQYDCEVLVSRSVPDAEAKTILNVAQESQGHPLLLTYLIAEAQRTETVSDSETRQYKDVEAYYELVWRKSLGDNGVQWLLATLARLRGTVSADELIRMMPTDLQTTFPHNLRAVEHLLARYDNQITFYHSSFADFVVRQTSDIGSVIQERIADYCQQGLASYAKTNRLFHNLLSGSEFRKRAIEACDQTWADEVAVRCVNPAWIMSDVDSALRCSVESNDFVQVIRVLLLRSRLRFRYNEIFVEFANELAQTVLLLRGPDEALGYLHRDGVYLCSPGDVASILQSLVNCGYDDHAFRFFGGFRSVFWTALEHGREVDLFQLRDFALATCWGTNDIRALQMDLRRLQTIFGEDEETQMSVWGHIHGDLLWRIGQLIIPDRDLADDPRRLGTTLAIAITLANKKRLYFGQPDSNSVLLAGALMKADVGTLVEKLVTEHGVVSGYELTVSRALVEQKLDPLLVRDVASSVKKERPSLRDDNGVDASMQALHQIYQVAQIEAYTEDAEISVTVGSLSLRDDATISDTDWERNLSDAADWLGRASGRSHRRRRDGKTGDDVSLVFTFLSDLFVPLEKRSGWDRSYHIPESVMPQIIAWSTTWIAEFHPEAAPEFVDFLLNAPTQLGIYTEGYRASLRHVVDIFGANSITQPSARKIEVAFLRHVTNGVFNRTERISALLQGARAAAEMNAGELATNAFRSVLSSSMGPSWYKENQFSLVQTALEMSTDASAIRRAIGLLELASSECTFQRFVRHHKQWLIGHLAECGAEQSALDLFIHYVLPSPQTQRSRLESISVDKVDELRGGRFGVLEVEQQGGAAGIIPILTDASPARLWAIVELFWPVDDRYSTEFATVARPLLADDGAVRARFLRMLRVDIEPKRRDRFVIEFGDLENMAWLADSPFAPSASITETQTSKPTRDSDPDEHADDAGKFVLPGTFGEQSALENLRIRIEEASHLIDDPSAGVAMLLEGLVQARDSGWQIWRGGENTNEAIEAIFKLDGESIVGIRRLADLIVSDQWTPDWTIAQTLIGLVLPNLSADERILISECLFSHVEALVAPEREQIDTGVEEAFLNELTSCSSDDCVDQLLIAFLDHPDWHTRSRVADIVFWLLDQGEFVPSVLVERIVGERVGFGRELAVGLLDAFNQRENGSALNLSALEQDPSCIVRGLALDPQPSPTNKTSERIESEVETDLETDYEWPARLDAFFEDHQVKQKAEEELEKLTATIPSSTMSMLWEIRELGFSAETLGTGNPFEREAIFRSLSKIPNEHDSSALLSWNPHWPDSDLDSTWCALASEVREMIETGPGNHFTRNGQTLLHCCEVAVTESDSIEVTEIMAMFVPDEYFEGGVDFDRLFHRTVVHSTQTESNPTSILVAPSERAARPFHYSEMVGGHLTPAVPSAFAAKVLGETGYSRQAWRDGREWRPLGPGKPLSQCVALMVDEQHTETIEGYHLVWAVRILDSICVVDPTRERIFWGK